MRGRSGWAQPRRKHYTLFPKFRRQDRVPRAPPSGWMWMRRSLKKMVNASRRSTSSWPRGGRFGAVSSITSMDLPVVIQLPAPFRVNGLVLDAQTNVPIDEFKSTHGISFVIERGDNAKGVVVSIPEYPQQTLWRYEDASIQRGERFESGFSELPLLPVESYSVIMRVGTGERARPRRE